MLLVVINKSYWLVLMFLYKGIYYDLLKNIFNYKQPNIFRNKTFFYLIYLRILRAQGLPLHLKNHIWHMYLMIELKDNYLLIQIELLHKQRKITKFSSADFSYLRVRNPKIIKYSKFILILSSFLFFSCGKYAAHLRMLIYKQYIRSISLSARYVEYLPKNFWRKFDGVNGLVKIYKYSAYTSKFRIYHKRFVFNQQSGINIVVGRFAMVAWRLKALKLILTLLVSTKIAYQLYKQLSHAYIIKHIWKMYIRNKAISRELFIKVYKLVYFYSYYHGLLDWPWRKYYITEMFTDILLYSPYYTNGVMPELTKQDRFEYIGVSRKLDIVYVTVLKYFEKTRNAGIHKTFIYFWTILKEWTVLKFFKLFKDKRYIFQRKSKEMLFNLDYIMWRVYYSALMTKTNISSLNMLDLLRSIDLSVLQNDVILKKFIQLYLQKDLGFETRYILQLRYFLFVIMRDVLLKWLLHTESNFINGRKLNLLKQRKMVIWGIKYYLQLQNLARMNYQSRIHIQKSRGVKYQSLIRVYKN